MQRCKTFFSQILFFCRTLEDLPRTQFGELIGVSHTTVTNYETGYRQPNNEILTKISTVLKIPFNVLLHSLEQPEATTEELLHFLIKVKDNATLEGNSSENLRSEINSNCLKLNCEALKSVLLITEGLTLIPKLQQEPKN